MALKHKMGSLVCWTENTAEPMVVVGRGHMNMKESGKMACYLLESTVAGVVTRSFWGEPDLIKWTKELTDN